MNEVSQGGKDAPPIRILGISGSLRAASYNTALLRAAAELTPDNAVVEIFDLSPIPMYNEDVRAEGFPAPVAALHQALNTADAVILASPEYNRSVSGALKNAIDWASRAPDQPFAGKPVAVTGVSRGALGAAFANHHLRQILVYLDAMTIQGPEVMIGGAPRKFDESGALIDQPTREFLAAHLTKLIGAVENIRLIQLHSGA